MCEGIGLRFASLLFVLVLSGLGLFGPNSLSLAQGDTWTQKQDMPTARYGLAASIANGIIYALGGANADNAPALSTVEAYDVSTDSWTTKANMPTERFLLSTSEVNGIIYAIGGSTAPGNSLSRVEMYDPEIDSCTFMTDMPTPRWGLATSTKNDRVYAIGGGGGTGGFVPLSTVEEYDPASDPLDVEDPPLVQGIPAQFMLHQNYPNPFNPATVVSYQLPVASHVKLSVFDLLGREVCVLVNERRAAGTYQDTFDGTGLASGVYVSRLTVGAFVQSKKMLLMK